MVTVTSGTKHTISGLVSFVVYLVRVAAMTSHGTGPFSDPIVELSGEDSAFVIAFLYACQCIHVLVPSTSPRSLMVDGVTDTTVTLSWMTSLKSNGVIIQYDVHYRRVGTSPFITQSFTGLTGTITGLTANTTYHIGVTAVTIVGNGPFSTFISQRTGK